MPNASQLRQWRNLDQSRNGGKELRRIRKDLETQYWCLLQDELELNGRMNYGIKRDPAEAGFLASKLGDIRDEVLDIEESLDYLHGRRPWLSDKELLDHAWVQSQKRIA